MGPESNLEKQLLAKLRQAQAELGGRVEELRAEGLEVDVFLETCAQLEAELEGRGTGLVDLGTLFWRVDALLDELLAIQRLHQQADAVKAVMEMPQALEGMEKMAAALRERGTPMEARAADEIEASLARFRNGLGEGKFDQEALEDMSLTAQAQLAEVERRRRFYSAACALYWEKWPEERLAKLSAEERLKFDARLESWRKDKEQVLGSLPIGDRRRLEAMSYEDFDKPGACDP